MILTTRNYILSARLVLIWLIATLQFYAHAESCPNVKEIAASLEIVRESMAPLVETLPRKLEVVYRSSKNYINGSVHGWQYPKLTLEISGSKCGSGLSNDGLKMMICHEYGHLFGGEPIRFFIFRDIPFSVEGEADLFAAAVCLPKIFEKEDNLSFLKLLEDEPGLHFCRNKANEQDIALCVRIAMAGLDLSKYLYSIWDSSFMKNSPGEIPTFKNRDNNVVQKTLEDHPIPQCRLDTYKIGATYFEDNISSNPTFFGGAPTSDGALSKIQKPNCWYHD